MHYQLLIGFAAGILLGWIFFQHWETFLDRRRIIRRWWNVWIGAVIWLGTAAAGYVIAFRAFDVLP
jgi:hypothetical protein